MKDARRICLGMLGLGAIILSGNAGNNYANRNNILYQEALRRQPEISDSTCKEAREYAVKNSLSGIEKINWIFNSIVTGAGVVVIGYSAIRRDRTEE